VPQCHNRLCIQAKDIVYMSKRPVLATFSTAKGPNLKKSLSQKNKKISEVIALVHLLHKVTTESTF
jgi:hypothetical protein